MSEQEKVAPELTITDLQNVRSIIDIAATLTHILNLQRSGAMTGKPFLEVLEK